MKFDWLITFRSITYAQRGQQVLQGAGVGCSLRRTPKELSGRGCGYGLAIRGADALAAAELLRQQDITFNKVFAQRSDGKMEERRV